MGVLRLLLAICVFCAHSRPIGGLRWLHGDLAVELFFVISGFYMQLVLTTRYTEAKLGNRWRSYFYKARYFRLLPIYLAGCTIVIGVALLRPTLAPVVHTWNYVWQLPETAGNLVFKAFLCLTNMTIFFQDVTLFLAVHSGHVHWSANFYNSDVGLWTGLAIPQAWSLGIEMSFYIVAPYLLNLRSRWLILGAFCSLIIKVIAIEIFNLADPWTYRFFPFELGYFLLGALAFRYRSRLTLDSFLPEWFEKWCAYPLVIGFVTFSLPPHLSTVVCPFILATTLPFLFRVTAGLNADRLIGELSYPFYIFHYFALVLARHITHHWLHGYESLLVAWVGLGLTLALSSIGLAAENRFVEPWRAQFHRAHSRQLDDDGAQISQDSAIDRLR